MYCNSSNKCPGVYLLWDIQDPAFKQNWHLFEAYRLFLIAYFKGTLDLLCSLIVAHLRGI